jgi:hypothetical protein
MFGIFDPALRSVFSLVAHLPFSLVTAPPLPCIKVQYLQTVVSDREWGVLSGVGDHILQ